MSVSQQSGDKAANRRAFLEKVLPWAHESGCAIMQTAPSPPPSLVHLPSRFPSPPSVLKSFEAQMWADSGYFLSCRGSFMSQALDTHRTEAHRVITNPNTLAGRKPHGPANTVMFYARLLSGLVCLCADGGFTGLRPPDRWAQIFCLLRSWRRKHRGPRGINSSKRPKAEHGLCSPQ